MAALFGRLSSETRRVLRRSGLFSALSAGWLPPLLRLLLLNRSFFFCQTYFRLIWKYLKLLLFVILPLLRMSVSTAPRATTFIIVFLSIEFPILDESPPSPPLGTSSVEDFSLRVLNSLLGSLFATELIWHSPLIYRRLSHTWQGWVLCGSLLLHCCPQDLKLVPTNGNFLPIWF
jgi:hypothetical protein